MMSWLRQRMAFAAGEIGASRMDSVRYPSVCWKFDQCCAIVGIYASWYAPFTDRPTSLYFVQFPSFFVKMDFNGLIWVRIEMIAAQMKWRVDSSGTDERLEDVSSELSLGRLYDMSH